MWITRKEYQVLKEAELRENSQFSKYLEVLNALGISLGCLLGEKSQSQIIEEVKHIKKRANQKENSTFKVQWTDDKTSEANAVHEKEVKYLYEAIRVYQCGLEELKNENNELKEEVKRLKPRVEQLKEMSYKELEKYADNELGIKTTDLADEWLYIKSELIEMIMEAEELLDGLKDEA